MTGYTAAGLPYPSPQDPVADTDLHIKNLAQAIDHRLANQPLQVSRRVLTTGPSADVIVTFPKLQTLTGLVIQPYPNGGAAGGSIWVLYPMLMSFAGNSAAVHVWYADTGANGYSVNHFANASHEYSLFSWGVPV